MGDRKFNPQSEAKETRQAPTYSGPPEFQILPGESLAKYRHGSEASSLPEHEINEDLAQQEPGAIHSTSPEAPGFKSLEAGPVLSAAPEPTHEAGGHAAPSGAESERTRCR